MTPFLFVISNVYFSSCLDIADLDGGKVATIDFPNPNDLTAFNVTITPDNGFWSGATYLFAIDIPAQYVSINFFFIEPTFP